MDQAGEELGTERNSRIQAENGLKKAVEAVARKAVANTLEWVHLKVETEREREKGRR